MSASDVVLISIVIFASVFQVIAALPRGNDIRDPPPTSGECGKNVSWSYDSSSHIISFVGSGDMTHYDGAPSVPWYPFRLEIEGFTMEGDITSFASFMFHGCVKIKSFDIPETVTNIEDFAFSECTALTSITIPDNVVSWSPTACYGCSNLKNYVVSETHPVYKEINGILFYKNGTSMVNYPCGKNATSYTVPDSVLSIGKWCFGFCESLESITITNSITVIEESTFSSCHGLKSFTIPSSVTEIKFQAFFGCISLTSIVIPQSVIKIERLVFDFCVNLGSISYEGKSDPNPTETVFNMTPVTHICVPSDYASNSFCGIAVGKSSSCDIIKKANMCYKAQFDGSKWGLVKTEEAEEYESFDGGCVKFVCDNSSGIFMYGNCNQSSTCVDDKCVSGDPAPGKDWVVHIDLSETYSPEVNSTYILSVLSELSELQTSELKIVTKVDEFGQVLSILVYVDDQKNADKIVSTVNNLTKDGVCNSEAYGILCRATKVYINVKDLFISAGLVAQEFSLLSLLVAFTILYFF